jgi:hypothetical protein
VECHPQQFHSKEVLDRNLFMCSPSISFFSDSQNWTLYVLEVLHILQTIEGLFSRLSKAFHLPIPYVQEFGTEPFNYQHFSGVENDVA